MTETNKKLKPVEIFMVFVIGILILATISKILSDYPFLVVLKEDLTYSEYVGYAALSENLNSTKQYGRIEFKYDNNQKTGYLVCSDTGSDASYSNCPIVNELRDLKKKDQKKFWYPVKIESALIEIPIIGLIMPKYMLTKKVEILNND